MQPHLALSATHEAIATREKDTPTIDPELTMIVRRHMSARASIGFLEVLVSDRGVVLRGRSATYYGKQLAQHAVLTVAQLPLIANEIEVC
jgi:hypothetical protein